MPLRIVDVVPVPTESAYFHDDQAAVRAGATRDGFAYRGTPVTPGFRRIREPGRALSVLVVLSDGTVLTGDCVQVQYTGVAGRAAPLALRSAATLIDTVAKPLLVGRPVAAFRDSCALLRKENLPPSLRYGLSQCLLRAAAHATSRTMAEVVVAEWGLPRPGRQIPVFTQGGDAPLDAVDKMILKRADALPHGLINNVASKLGHDGEKLAELVGWLARRIPRLMPDPSYRPVLHFDVYGTIGQAFGDNEPIVDYLLTLERAATPYRLRIEHPVDAGSRDAQIRRLGDLRAQLRAAGGTTELVADEWCNTLADIEEFVAAGCVDMVHVKTPDLGGLDDTVEALLACRRGGVAAYCGGTCNETMASAQACAQVALACDAQLLLAKPGMGVDEGLSVVRNEMRAALSIINRRALWTTSEYVVDRRNTAVPVSAQAS